MSGIIGRDIGGYRILEQIGQGGMAKVYKAYQPAVDRVIALKLLPDLHTEDEISLARFRKEAKIIASLEHPHIIPVYDFGEADDTAFLVMRYLQAGNLKNLLAAAPDGILSLSDAILLISQIASALDYAHQQGIIHRDVKPSNILIDTQGQAFLTDFGIAKVLEDTSHLTKTGSTLGTPAYMSPEQAAGKEVDGRSDLYSLGIILYQMLTGRPPFEADTPYATIIAHINEPLPLPRKIDPQIPAELEQILLKALAKDPEDRFQSAQEFQDALSFFIISEQDRGSSPLQGISRSLAEQVPEEGLSTSDRSLLNKITRTRQRKKLVPYLVSGFFLLALITAGGLIYRASQRAAQQESGILVQVEVSPTPTESEPTLNPTITLTPTITPTPTPTLHPMAENPYLGPVPEGARARLGKGTANDIDLSPDGKTLAIGGSLGVWLYDADTFHFQKYFETSTPINTVMWSPKGNKIAAGTENNFVILLDPESGERLFTLSEHSGDILCLDWSPDGSMIASGSKDGNVVLWDSETGEILNTLYGYSGAIRDIAWSPDGKKMAGVVHHATILWNADTGIIYKTFKPIIESDISYWSSSAEIQDLTSVSWSPDSEFLVIGSNYDADYYDLVTAMAIRSFDDERIWERKGTQLKDLFWSPSGEFLVGLENDGTIALIDRYSGNTTNKLGSPDSPITSIAISNDNSKIVGSTMDGSIIKWDIDSGSIEKAENYLFQQKIYFLNWTNDSSILVINGPAGSIQYRNHVNNELISTFSDGLIERDSLTLSPSGKLLATGGNNKLSVWNMDDNSLLSSFSFQPLVSYGMNFENEIRDYNITSFSSIVWAEDESYVLSNMQNIGHDLSSGQARNLFFSKVAIIDPYQGERSYYIDPHQRFTYFKNFPTLEELVNMEIDITSISVSPDRNLTASVCQNNTIVITENTTNERVQLFIFNSIDNSKVAFSPNGKYLAGSSQDLVIWDMDSGEEVFTLSGHTQPINSISWSPDNTILASGAEDRTVILWDPMSGETLRLLEGHHGPVTSLEFSSDGSTLASGSEDGTIILWDMTKLID